VAGLKKLSECGTVVILIGGPLSHLTRFETSVTRVMSSRVLSAGPSGKGTSTIDTTTNNTADHRLRRGATAVTVAVVLGKIWWPRRA